MLKTKFIATVLAVLASSVSLYAADSYNYADYSNFSYTNTGGNVTIEVGAGDYSAFDMYNKSNTDSLDSGVIIGGASQCPVSNLGANNGTVNSVSITLDGADNVTSVMGIGYRSSKVSGAIEIEVKDSSVTYVVGGAFYEKSAINATTGTSSLFVPKSANNNVKITIGDGAEVGVIYGGHRDKSSVQGAIDKAIANNTYDAVMAAKEWELGGSVTIIVEKGAKVGSIYGAGTPKQAISGDVSVTVDGGNVTGSIIGGACGNYSEVGGSTSILITNDATVGGSVYGCVADSNATPDKPAPTVRENVSVVISGNAKVEKDVYAVGNGAKVGQQATVSLQDNAVVEGTVYAYGTNAEAGQGAILLVGTEDKAYTGSVGNFSGFENVVVTKGSSMTTTSATANIFDATIHTYTVTQENMTQAITTTSGTVAVNAPITLNLNSDGTLPSGKYMLIDASAGTVDQTNWDAAHVSVTGLTQSLSDLRWDGNILYLLYQGKDAQSAMAANWGVFKSSQAFVSTLWGSRSNAVQLMAEPTYAGVNAIAWASVYGSASRISNQGSATGANYSIYGAAIGAEFQLNSARSLGIAFGYDWGKTSPLDSSSGIDQNAMHIALYGRAGQWDVGSKGCIAFDWSASVGKVDSDSPDVSSAWCQDTLQLDARLSYIHPLTEKLNASAFVGTQYYAQDADTADNMEIGSLQNLRLQAGAGINYQIARRATLFAEASIYNDTMRHNPEVNMRGATFESANPGRLGAGITAGAAYRTNKNWNFQGSYSLETADNSTAHTINLGVSRSF